LPRKKLTDKVHRRLNAQTNYRIRFPVITMRSQLRDNITGRVISQMKESVRSHNQFIV